MSFRACPTAKTAEHFIDFHDYRSYVAEISFYFATSEVFGKSRSKLISMCYNRCFEPLELLDAPVNRQCRTCKEKLALLSYNLTNNLLCIICIHV